MGAPGEAFLCWKGHLFHWIEEGLWWGGPGVDEETGRIIDISSGLFEESEEIRREVCPCGAPTLIVLNHYGDINDCLSEEERLTLIMVEKLRFRVKGAVNAQGKPIEAFLEKEVPVYDVSRIVQERVAQEGY
jgi:hypothetical protein